MRQERMQFCAECRAETKYRIHRASYSKCIKDKEYVFEILEAVCEKCGEPVNLAGQISSKEYSDVIKKALESPVKVYFEEVAKEYKIDSVKGIKEYIGSRLS